MNEPSRTAVLAALREKVAAELDVLLAVTTLARDEATHGDSRPENKYDTRALEASYLAAGQGRRIDELRRLRDWFAVLDPRRGHERVEPGAIVYIERDDGVRSWKFVAPVGGSTVQVDDITVQVVSPASPLGRALAGLVEGDDAEVDGPAGEQGYEVLRVL